MPAPLIVGLTGGIACGKSTVAQHFVQRGAELIDADVIAREVVAPNTPGLAAIVQHFGRSVLREDGGLNRPALGAIVFSDPTQLRALNAMLHPAIEAEIRQRVAVSKAEVVVIDAALLVQLRLDALCDLVVVVWAEPKVQIQRLMARNGLTAEQAQQRLDAQQSHEERLGKADVAIDNNAGLDELVAAVQKAWRRIETAIAAADPQVP